MDIRRPTSISHISKQRGYSVDTRILVQIETLASASLVLEATREERHLISDMEEEDDVVDAVVDGWNHRLLVEKQPLHFEDLMKEDIMMRTKEEEEEEEPRVGETSEAASGSVIGGNDLKELQDLMVAGFKQMNEKLDSVTQRLNAVEVFVSEVRNTGDPPRSVRSDVGVGRGVSDGVDLLANAARAVVGEHDQEKEKDDGTGEDRGKEKENEAQDQEAEDDGGKEKGKDAQAEAQDEAEDEAQGGCTPPPAKKAKKGRKKRTHSKLNEAPFQKPRTRQRTREEC